MAPTDRVRLEHMLECAQAAMRDLGGMSAEQLRASPTVARSIIRCLEIVGEAAAQVSPETRASADHVPRADVVAMRNRLIHAYWDVDLDIVWDTVTMDLPDLQRQLLGLLEDEGEGP